MSCKWLLCPFYRWGNESLTELNYCCSSQFVMLEVGVEPRGFKWRSLFLPLCYIILSSWNKDTSQILSYTGNKNCGSISILFNRNKVISKILKNFLYQRKKLVIVLHIVQKVVHQKVWPLRHEIKQIERSHEFSLVNY